MPMRRDALALGVAHIGKLLRQFGRGEKRDPRFPKGSANDDRVELIVKATVFDAIHRPAEKGE
jgi:hypothetical protein